MTAYKIKYPCPENWDTMKIGLHSRYCDNCQKDVIDFTDKKRDDILKYLFINHDKQICGRIYPSQLDFSHTDILVVINGLSENQKKSNLPFYLLAVGALMLAGCNDSTNNKAIEPVNKNTLTIDSSKDKIVVEQKHVDSSSKSIKHLPKLVEPTEQGLVGQIMFRDPIEDTSNEPYMFVEVMPEFVGGIDSLTSYLKQKINYPKWEKENKIEGTEIVTFLVDKDGNIKDAKVIRSVKGSKNFDEEVLRVINNMPSWKPGEHNNEQVDVKYTLPIKFEF